jgi:hypothetical protein
VRCHNSSVPRLAALLVTVAAMVVAAGCGGTTQYTLEATRACLKDGGLHVRPAPADDFVASTALNGAMNVKFLDNQVTLAFGEDEAEAARLAKAYRRFKGKNIGIESALEELKNAVLIWAITPPNGERGAVHACLKG